HLEGDLSEVQRRPWPGRNTRSRRFRLSCGMRQRRRGFSEIAEMPFVTSRGSQIHYSVEGSGPLVILLHGLLSNAKSWKRWGVVDALADGYCVACVDSLGHGLSDKPSDESVYGLEARSRDVVAVIDDLGFESAHVLGYSMGRW